MKKIHRYIIGLMVYQTHLCDVSFLGTNIFGKSKSSTPVGGIMFGNDDLHVCGVMALLDKIKNLCLDSYLTVNWDIHGWMSHLDFLPLTNAYRICSYLTKTLWCLFYVCLQSTFPVPKSGTV